MKAALLVSVLFGLFASVSASAQAPPPCEGRTGVVDGVDEDGIVCDVTAQQAALARFVSVTAAADAAKFVQPPCDLANKAAVGAKLAGAKEWAAGADRAARTEDVAGRQVDALQEMLSAERKLSVVDLLKLHQLEIDVRTQTAAKASAHAEAVADRAKAAKASAEAKAAMGACHR